MDDDTIAKLENGIRDLDFAIANTIRREQVRNNESVKLPRLTNFDSTIHLKKSHEVYNQWHQDHLLESNQEFLTHYYNKKMREDQKQIKKQTRRAASRKYGEFFDKYYKSFVCENKQWKSSTLKSIKDETNHKRWELINNIQKEKDEKDKKMTEKIEKKSKELKDTK